MRANPVIGGNAKLDRQHGSDWRAVLKALDFKAQALSTIAKKAGVSQAKAGDIMDDFTEGYGYAEEVYPASGDYKKVKYRLTDAGGAEMFRKRNPSATVPSRVGESLRISAYNQTLVVKKKSAGSYYASVEGRQGSRWGNKAEILEDIQYFLESGSLPTSQGTPMRNPSFGLGRENRPTNHELAIALGYIDHEFTDITTKPITSAMWAEGLAHGRYEPEQWMIDGIRQMRPQLSESDWEEIGRLAYQEASQEMLSDWIMRGGKKW